MLTAIYDKSIIDLIASPGDDPIRSEAKDKHGSSAAAYDKIIFL